MTLPPRPPSPPSGPPIGVRHSLRKLVHPEPPVPPSTLITTRSMNTYCSGVQIGTLRLASTKPKQGAASAAVAQPGAFILARDARGTRIEVPYANGIALGEIAAKLAAPCFGILDPRHSGTNSDLSPLDFTVR